MGSERAMRAILQSHLKAKYQHPKLYERVVDRHTIGVYTYQTNIINWARPRGEAAARLTPPMASIFLKASASRMLHGPEADKSAYQLC